MKYLILSIQVIFFTSFLNSQNDSNISAVDWSPDVYEVGKIYPGYIIKQDGDTIQGYVKAGIRCAVGGMGSSNQNQVLFYASPNDRKPMAKYKPKDLKGYKVADKVYESINYSGGLFKKANFNVVAEDGALRIYEWYSTVENFSSIRKQSSESWQAYDARRYDTKIIIAKNGVDPIEHSMLGLSFSKKLPPLIQDYPELAQKVKSKDKGYGFLNMFAVIKEYNEWKRNN